MSSVSEANLIAKLEPVVAQLDLELDHLDLSKSGKYRVLELTIDGDKVDLEAISTVSRKVSQYLDETNLMGEQPYTLEVTTRGIDRPLVKPTHWRRNLGRLVKFQSAQLNGVGRIIKFENPIVSIQTDKNLYELDITQITQAVIQVEFNKPNEQG